MSDDKVDALDAPLANELENRAVIMQLVELRELSHYRSRNVWMSLEQIADPTFPLRNVQSSHVMDLAASMRAFPLFYRNGMILAT